MADQQTRAGPPFLYWACLFGIGAAIPLVAIAIDLLFPQMARLPGRDFATFWSAGRLAIGGTPALAYDLPELQRAATDWLSATAAPFVYPPPMLFLLAPFGALPYPVALAAWTIAGMAFFAWAARPFTSMPLILTVLTPAALLNVWDGQFGFLIGGLWLCAFRFSERPLPGGLAAASLILKPHITVLAAPRYLLAPRTALAAAGVLGALVLATLPLWPPFIASLSAYSQSIPAEGAFLFRLMPGAFAAYGNDWTLHLLFAAAAGAALIHYRQFDAFTLATATFLILPYAHNYDMTVANLGFAVLLHRDWAALDWWRRGICSLAFLAPTLTMAAGWAIPPILLVGLIVQARQQRLYRDDGGAPGPTRTDTSCETRF